MLTLDPSDTSSDVNHVEIITISQDQKWDWIDTAFIFE